MKEEQVDILDENGELTGKTVSLVEAHETEMWHGVAHIWVYNSKKQMLMHRRHPDLSWGAGKWDIAGGGHISAAEDPKDAAVRELREEMGLKADEDKLKLVGITVSVNTSPKSGKKHRVFEWNYVLGMEVDLKDVRLQEDEATEAAWFVLDEMENDLNTDMASEYTPREISLYALVINAIKEI